MSSAVRIEMSDFEQVWRAFSNLTLEPCKNILYEIAPAFGAFASGYTPIVPEDLGQQSLIPPKAAQKILSEVDSLRRCAGLNRTISVYTALNFHFTGFGGALSLTRPILVAPYHRIFRPNNGYLGDGKDQTALASNIRTFTDDETRFHLARQIGHIKYNDALLRTLAKIVLVAAIFALCTTPLGWAGTIAIASAAVCMYVACDRIYEQTIDLFAAKILGERIEDPERAHRAAISSLEKLRQENLERREKNLFCKAYLTENGDNLLDFKHPFLTTRIARLQNSLEMLKGF